METQWLARIDVFAPSTIFHSAGFDGHREDTLADSNLSEADFARVTRLAVDAAGRHAGGRIVSVLEGGYALDALGRSASAHVKAPMGV